MAAAVADDVRWEAAPAAAHRTGWLVEQVLESPRTPHLVAAYFDEAGGAAGASFDLLAPTEPNHLEPGDLLVLGLLGFTLSPNACRTLLSRPFAVTIGASLRAVPAGAQLWAARPTALDAAAAVLTTLCGVDGFGPETAAALLARKRPALVPIVDTAAAGLLELPSGAHWATLRAVLDDAGRRDRIEALRPPGLPAEVPLLRLLEVAVWAAASGGRRERDGSRVVAR